MSDLLEQPATWIGAAVAAVGVAAGWFRDRKRGDIDQNTMLFAEWKKINDEYKAQIEPLQAKVDKLGERLSSAEHRIDELEDDKRKLLVENDGLKRQLAQKSQSEAVMLGAAIGGNAPSGKAKFVGQDAVHRRTRQAGGDTDRAVTLRDLFWLATGMVAIGAPALLLAWLDRSR